MPIVFVIAIIIFAELKKLNDDLGFAFLILCLICTIIYAYKTFKNFG